jgi:hypothetical protein
LGEKARAWKVLQESIKCNFENWQVWDNLMVVSIDCAEYQEVSNLVGFTDNIIEIGNFPGNKILSSFIGFARFTC